MAARNALPVTVTIPSNLLGDADRIARTEGRTRSEVFREGLRALLWKRRWESIQTLGRQTATRRGLKPRDVERIVDELRS